MSKDKFYFPLMWKSEVEMKNLKDFGKALRKIRKDKGLTLAKLGKKEISTSTLSAFERGEKEIRISNFYLLIRRLRISFQEFWYIVNDYDLSDFEKTWKEITDLYNEGKLNDLKHLLLVLEQKKDSGSTYEELEYLMLKNLIGSKDQGFGINSDEKEMIVDYLKKNKSWTAYELFVYANVLNSFDVEVIKTLSDDLLKRTSLYRSIPQNRITVTRILLSTMAQMLKADDFESATRYQNEVKPLLDDLDMYEKTIFHFLDGAINFSRGKKSAGKEAMQEAIGIFRTLKISGLADSYQKSYDDFVRISEDL